MEPKYSLRFDFLPAWSNDLITGELLLLVNGQIDMTGRFIWNATSGLPGHQKPKDCTTKGKGPIPPTELLLKRNGGYEVDTLGQMNNAKGIAGFIFPIYPEQIKLEDENGVTVTRSDFGIHFDANVPGSAGCIVLTDAEQFTDFCENMRMIHSKGQVSIPLEVRYFPET